MSENTAARDSMIALANRIARLYEPGAKARHVSRELGTHYDETRWAFRELGWPLRQGTAPGISPQNQKVADFVKADPTISITVVAARFCMTKQRVSQILKKAKITKVHAQTAQAAVLRARRRDQAADAERARQDALRARIAHAGALRARGWMLKQIAHEMGTSLMSACRLCKAHEDRTNQQPGATRSRRYRHV